MLEGDNFISSVLFGRNGFLQIPQLEGAVFASRDQDGLDGMEGQRSDAIKVTPQRVLGVPRLPEGFFVH